jgi:uncharacterized membrane protein YbhN (UPF0104 family)
MALQRRTLIRIAKWLIAVLVVIGLTWASRSAVHQWQEQKRIVQDAIDALQESIQAEPDVSKRNRLISQKKALQSAVPSLENLRWWRIGLAATLYAVGIFVPGFVLHQALGSLGEHPRRSTSIAAQLLGHAGKYVPGKAMVIVLRAGALSQENVSVKRATVAVFMDTLLMMAVGAAVAGVVICWLPVPDWMIWAAIFMAIAASLPTLPPVLTRVASFVSKTKPSDQNNDQNSDLDDAPNESATGKAAPATPSGSMKFFFIGWVFSLVSWLLIGAAFTALVTAIPVAKVASLESGENVLPRVEEPHSLHLCAVSTAAIGLAMVVGFASLLPGGAGVRELVLTTVLSTTIGISHALLAAIAARLLFIIVEAICAALAWLWLQRKSKQLPNHSARQVV